MSSSAGQALQSVGLLLLLVIALLIPTEGINKKHPQYSDSTRGTSRSDCYSAYDHKPLLKLTPCTVPMVEDINRITSEAGCVDISNPGVLRLPANGGCALGSVVCDATTAAKLIATFSGNVHILVNDTGNYFRANSGVTVSYDQMRSMQWPGSQADFYSSWRNLEAQEERVRSAVMASSGLATLETIGESCEGRPMYAVRITGPNFVQDGPKILMTFQIHAREWITGMAGCYVTEHLIAKAKANPNVFSNLQIVIVPMVNPDGFKYSETTMRMWRKNRHPIAGVAGCSGVDLNRNWPTDWNGPESTSNNPCSEIFVGDSAVSEPESKNVKALIDEPGQVALHLDFHSYSEMILEPWSWTEKPHPRRAEMDRLAMEMTNAIKGIHGKTYHSGGSEILYPASGVMPDYATEKGGIGFTIEMSPSQYETGGFMLPAAAIRPRSEEAFASVLAAMQFLQRQNGRGANVIPSMPVVYSPVHSTVPMQSAVRSMVPMQSAVQTVVPMQVSSPLQPVVPAAVPVHVQTPFPVQTAFPMQFPMSVMPVWGR